MSRGIVAIGSLVALTFGMSPAQAGFPPTNLDHRVLCSPTDRTFRTTSDNPYFPMLPGQLSILLDENDPDGPVGLRITVLNQTETFYSGTPNMNPVDTRVVEEFEWVDANEDGKFNGGEERIEVSRNYFAQTEEGTVCYFGEDVKIYEDGKFQGDTTGSWRADDESNAPGIIMPAVPAKGQVYLQEDAPDVAMDLARNVKISTVTVGGTTYTSALQTKECNLVEDPNCTGDISTKTYAPGKGLVRDGDAVLTGFKAGK
jgi:hypothetical protein